MATGTKKKKRKRPSQKGTKARSQRRDKDERASRTDSESWEEAAARRAYEWLARPRIHPDIFNKLAAHPMPGGGIISVSLNGSEEAYYRYRENLQKTIDNKIGHLGWKPERQKLFSERMMTYGRDPSIRNYVRIRRDFPEVEIDVRQFGGIEALFKLAGDFRAQGIDPQLIAGALNSVEYLVDALCLRLLELLVERDQLPKTGPGHIDRRRSAISDATVNYLILTILEAYLESADEWQIPGSLVTLVRHQLCGNAPDLETEYRARERKANIALILGQSLGPDERVSISKLTPFGISRATAGRWLADAEFRDWIERGRQWAAEGLFEKGRKAGLKRIMGK